MGWVVRMRRPVTVAAARPTTNAATTYTRLGALKALIKDIRARTKARKQIATGTYTMDKSIGEDTGNGSFNFVSRVLSNIPAIIRNKASRSILYVARHLKLMQTRNTTSMFALS